MKSSQHSNLIGAHWCPLVPIGAQWGGTKRSILTPAGARWPPFGRTIWSQLFQFQPYFSRQKNTNTQNWLYIDSCWNQMAHKAITKLFLHRGCILSLIFWALLAHLILFQLPDLKTFWNLNCDPKWTMKRHYEEVAFKVCGLLPQERSLLWGVPSAQKSRHHLN